MGTGFEVCESWYDYKEENDVMYNFISVFDSIARVMETEGIVRLDFQLVFECQTNRYDFHLRVVLYYVDLGAPDRGTEAEQPFKNAQN